jgi:glycosyltransferase involved in cell wall biosynthesis
MRIGIDARELGGQPTGVGRYLAGLLREWSREGNAVGHEFVLYAPETLTIALDTYRFRTRIINGPPGTWWEQVRLPPVAARDHLDLFFAPAYTAPLRMRVPTVVTIHDLSYMAHPEWFSMREGARRRLLTRHAAARARAVVTVSAFSRLEILTYLRLPPDRVHVIPQGIDCPPITRVDRASPRILYVGAIFNRRHLPDLVRAFDALARRHPMAQLDIVGPNRTFPREDIARAIDIGGLGGRARRHQYLVPDKLNDLYARARVFAFLSEYEGLGTTPLEALAAGIPPVVTDTPVAHETLGDAALYVPRGDIARITHGLEVALFDEHTRAQILAAAPAVLARYDWARAARETLAVLERAAGSPDQMSIR